MSDLNAMNSKLLNCELSEQELDKVTGSVSLRRRPSCSVTGF
jgi:hypothetical protein